jgi:UDP-N-acetylglucosamine--N-acetylmuramyl-(pentapeptide) pyrophosphoryl-undecaprenol N-acetylglucosamine transferase
VPKAGYPLHLVGMVPFAGRGRVLAPAALVRAAWQARRILRRERAAVAVGMGGYASIPLIAGARLAGVPSLIHESGAIPGRANLLAARLTPNVALAFESARASFPPSSHPRTVGMPLVHAITGFDRERLRGEARMAFSVPPAAATVLVLGGSQGAATLNRAAIGLALRWRGRHDRHVVLKTGAAALADVNDELERQGCGSLVTVTSFIERMDLAYAAADLALCRAGAGTVAELATTGLPAILVPYPYAPHDHQAVNAATLVEPGAAVLVRDHEATPERLGPLVDGLIDDGAALATMGAAARDAARPHAADELAAWVLDLARDRRAATGAGTTR